MTAQADTPLVELRDLQKVYRLGDVEVPALRGVSATIQTGEMLAIIGPSGSGKSTLMNILGCLDHPTSGSYLLQGDEVGSFSDDRLAEIRRQMIGFVFQTFNLLSRMTAWENVALPLLYTGAKDRKEQALAALDRVKLSHRANHKPTELSGGEQQRVAIARSLINHPPVILADEPTGNLDSSVGHEIIELFRELNRDGITVVLVTHDPEISAEAPRTISIRDGLIVGDETRTRKLA
jgi:putative ABC transport system ATP-binding protein